MFTKASLFTNKGDPSYRDVCDGVEPCVPAEWWVPADSRYPRGDVAVLVPPGPFPRPLSAIVTPYLAMQRAFDRIRRVRSKCTP